MLKTQTNYYTDEVYWSKCQVCKKETWLKNGVCETCIQLHYIDYWTSVYYGRIGIFATWAKEVKDEK